VDPLVTTAYTAHVIVEDQTANSHIIDHYYIFINMQCLEYEFDL